MLTFISKNTPDIRFKPWGRGSIHKLRFSNFSKELAMDRLPVYDTYFFNLAFSSSLRFRRLVLRANQYAYISSSSIEAFRKVISPHFRKKNKRAGRFDILVYSFFILTKKPAEVRMGGGKGAKIRGSYTLVRPGQIIFDILSINPKRSKVLFDRAIAKLGIRASIHFILNCMNF